MKLLKNTTIWIICILSFLAALFYNQLNLNKLPENLKRAHQTVISKDDVSYLTPPTNYLETGHWKGNSLGKQSYFVRSPGYGIFYLLFLKLAGLPMALVFLKIAQLLLFSCSVYWLFSISYSILNHKKLALIIASIYGLTPFAIGFLFYTLTEGITPALLLLYVFLLFKANIKKLAQQKIIFYFLASLTFAYLLIVRPPLGFMGLLLPIFLIKDYWKEGLIKLSIKLILFGSLAFSLMAMWQYRNFKITNEYVGLHSIYYADNNSIYRPTFKAYWNFVGGWAQEGQEVHSYMVPMWKAAIKGDTSEIYIKNALATFPKNVMQHYGEKRLTAVFRKYQKATLYQKKFYDQQLAMPLKTPQIEMEVRNEFNQLTKEYKSSFWFQYHVLSPLKVFKTMAFHSNLSLYIFQKTYRGNGLMETVRVLFYTLHSLCFILLIASFFFFKNGDWKKIALLFTVFSYVFYLCYFQRGIEERYTLPILPFLLIGLADLVLRQYKIISRRQS